MEITQIPDPVADPAAEGATGETQMDIANREEAPEQEEQDPDQKVLIEVLDKYTWRKPTSECVHDLIKKQSDYYQYCVATGKMALWRLVFEQYNRGFITLGSISRGGTEGELLNLPVNEFRNVVDHVVGLSTQDQLAFEPQPVNNDYTTAAQVTLSKGILNDYAKNRGLSGSCDRTALNAYLFGEGSVLKLFNENLGDIKLVDTVNQKIIRKGDEQFIELNPTNLIRDINVQQFKDNQWFIGRLFVNKYDLAAQFPKKARDITQKSIATDWDNTRLTAIRGEKSDLIPLYVGIHKPTSAVPFGRLIFYLDAETWLQDGHLDYRDFPVFTNMPCPVESINFGYTTAFDLLPLQQILDIIDGGHATNLSNFLVSNILVPENCNLGVADLIGSMNLLKYNAQAGKPEALNLVLFPPEGPNFRQFVVQRMEVLAGINATNRGQTEDKITSGTMAALYASQAIRFNGKFQKSYAEFCGSLASGVLHDLQDHPEEKRTGLVAGKGNKSYMKEFYGKDVNMIDRVIVQVGSPFAQTDAGKIQIAQDLLNSPAGLDPKEYLEVVETGSLEPLTEGPHRELMLIKAENERLSEGGVCKAVISDDHTTHIKEHKNVIADPGLRMSNDPMAAKIVTNTLTHIAEHEKLLMQGGQTRPILMGIIGQPVVGGGAPPPGPVKKPMAKPAPKPGAPAPAPAARPPMAGAGGPAAAPKPPMARPKMPVAGAPRGSVAVPAVAAPPPMAGGGAHA
jgi:hypothetical protein